MDLISFLQKGGVSVYILLILSIVSWAVIVERLLNLRKGKFLPKGIQEVSTLVARGDLEAAIKLLSLDLSEGAKILQSLLEKYKEGKDRELLLKNLEFELSLLVPKLERNIPLLSAIASLSPLVGLLGTIIGLIKVFSAFSAAEMNQGLNLLSMGISEALISAATGLTVAIPSLLAYWLFKIYANSILDELEGQIVQVLRVLK
ncbi:MotA/TolQ/ExbB proton channel family protein [Thermocrinis minervae]|uniref:Biopolymer transport protein ExbB n=1 Tax=Thermocrinis minervae TaxID=381751 RepID=A0A1M6QRQ0_9AQUI|nr:MotA/TolQ/ExbB proton channel family protein [Thermocrinis minervae]SHK22773.1 biopolymer transport protein ExbB [Thermocrinis minervae]